MTYERNWRHRKAEDGLTVLVDLDAICADLLGPWLRDYNRAWDDNLTVEKITHWGIHTFAKPECGSRIYDLIERPGMYRNLPLLPGAVEGIRSLQGHGHDVVIVTASASTPNTAAEKLEWIREHLSIDRRSVFIGHRKHLIKGDVLIDDSPENITDYRRAWPHGFIATIDYPYNRSAQPLCDFVAHDYTNTREAWSQLCAIIDEHHRRLCEKKIEASASGGA